MTNTDDFKDQLTAVADGERWGAADWDRRRGEHPDDETLLAYGAGRLGGGDDARVQEHLTTCTECRRLIGDLCAFPALDEIEGEPSEFEVAAAWRGVAVRIAESDESGGAAPAANDDTPFWKRLPFAWTVAASLGFAFLGTGAWNVGLQGSMAGHRAGSEAEAPTTVAVHFVLPDQPRGEPIYAAAGSMLIPPASAPTREQAVERGLYWQIVDEGERTVAGDRVTADAIDSLRENHAFGLLLPAGLRGRYELRLLAGTEPSGPPVETWPLIVE